MKKISFNDIINQRKLSAHLCIFLFSLMVVFISIVINSDFKSWSSHLDGFILLFIQLELFIFLSRLFFQNMTPGKTAGAITRIVLSRFALFLMACFVGAFIIYIAFLYSKQLVTGGSTANVLSGFLSVGLSSWFKPTISGLLFGTILYIIILWQEALRSELKLREENLVFQNETLKNQVNPHFLFNSLNTLSSLIATRPDTAEMFINKLSSIYRYILENIQKDIVPLQSEIAFIRDYFDLHKIRDEEKIVLTIDVSPAEGFGILPVSLQILLENAIKHNIATREKPLHISIFIEGQQIVVKNDLLKKAVQFQSTKIGLKNLAERVRLMTGKTLIIEETNTDFIVKVPLIV